MLGTFSNDPMKLSTMLGTIGAPDTPVAQPGLAYGGPMGAMGGAKVPIAGGAGTGFMGRMFNGLGGVEGLSSLMQGLGSIGGLYTSMQGLGLARDQLNFQRDAYNTNLTNQTQTYNTALEDRIRARHSTEGRPSEDTDRYLSNHRL